jgi:DNA ligase 1
MEAFWKPLIPFPQWCAKKNKKVFASGSGIWQFSAVAHNMITRPLLAATCELPRLLAFPVMATPKIDGVRCYISGGVARTRSGQPVPNQFIRQWIESNLPEGIDGEITCGTFAETMVAVATIDGEPDFTFHAFDLVTGSLSRPYASRMRDLAKLADMPCLVKLMPVKIASLAELEAYQDECEAAGHEGVMVRKPSGPYKCGRSTEGDEILLKLKRFADSEAVVVECHESGGEIRSVTVRDGKRVFRIAYQAALAETASLIGRVMKYSHQESGAGNAPRFAQFIGWRESFDL